MIISKINRISLSGGLIGSIFTNPRKAIDDMVAKETEDGWYCHQIHSHQSWNILIKFLQLTVLVCTLGLWTWSDGYLIVFHKDIERGFHA